jgi:hypothetical protein
MRFMIALFTSVALLAGCATQETVETPLVDLGTFKLGHNVVVASKMKKGPVSRDATEDEWKEAISQAVANRFSQYQGDQFYHMAISVEGYMLAPPGVPLVYKPKSALIINVTVWDDAAGKKLNDEVKQLTVLENTTGDSFVVGSGAARTKEEQIAGLSRNAVRQIEKWLVEERAANGWFGAVAPVAADVPVAAE